MENQNWISVLNEADLSGSDSGEVVAFDIELDSGETLSIAIIKDPSEKHGWVAIENVCSHDGEGMDEGMVDLEKCSIECPRHGAHFNIKTGKVLSMPAASDIRVFDLKVDEGKIQILV